MPTGHLATVLDHVRRLCSRGAGDALDGQLLDRFARQRDEAAFEALLGRHGPMVLGVCCRVLGDEHAADDAFQAAFLVLAGIAILALTLWVVARPITAGACGDAAGHMQASQTSP